MWRREAQEPGLIPCVPRYHFNVRDGRDAPDGEGIELPDESAARVQAIQAAGEMIRDWRYLRFEDYCEMDVTDDAGRTVLTLRFKVEQRA
jgi:hypothetical protein